MPTIHIPRRTARFGGFVNVGVNGRITRIPVGQDYTATDDEVTALTDAGVPTSRSLVPAGMIQLSATRYGPRLSIGINGVVTYLPTDKPFVASPELLAVLTNAGIVYEGSAFHPAQLFQAGNQGGYWDALESVIGNDQYNTARAVTGGMVGYVSDLSPNGNHVRAYDGNRPLLKLNGSTPYLDFVMGGGVNLLGAGFASGAATDRIIAIQQTTFTENGRIISGGTTDYNIAQTSGPQQGSIYAQTAPNYQVVGPAIGTIGADMIVTQRQADAASRIAINAQPYVANAVVPATAPGGISIGANWNFSTPAAFRMYAVLMIDRMLTDVEIGQVRAFLANRYRIEL